MSAFKIDAAEPPAGARPIGGGFAVLFPETTGFSGNGEPVGATGKPRIRLSFDVLEEAAWNWWMAKTGTNDDATFSSIDFWNPYKSGGAGWVTWTGGGKIQRPTYDGMDSGNFVGVEILLTDLLES